MYSYALKATPHFIRPAEYVAMHILGPLPRTKAGFEYMSVM